MDARRALVAAAGVLAGSAALVRALPARESPVDLQLTALVLVSSGQRVAVLEDAAGHRVPLPLPDLEAAQLAALARGEAVALPLLAGLGAAGAHVVAVEAREFGPDARAELVLAGFLGRARIALPAAQALVVAAAARVPFRALPSVVEASGPSPDELRQVRARRPAREPVRVHDL